MTLIMRNIGIAISAIVATLGLIGVVLFFASLLGIFGGDSDGLVYLIVLPPLIYSTIIFIKLIKDKEFHKTHKFTLHLLIWSTLVAIVISIFFAITAIAVGEGLGLWVAILALVFGILFASVLSFIGFIIDSFRNK